MPCLLPGRDCLQPTIAPSSARALIKAAQGAEIAAQAKTKVTTLSQAVEKFLEGPEAG
jgi:hypothetical protein